MPKSIQLSIAAAAISLAAAAAAHAPPVPDADPISGPGGPVVRIYETDMGKVDLRNGCVLTFNSYGRKMSPNRKCTTRMENYAREVFLKHQMGDLYKPARSDQ